MIKHSDRWGIFRATIAGFLIGILALSSGQVQGASAGPIALQSQLGCAGPCAALGLDGYSWDVVQQSIMFGGGIPAFGQNQDIVIVGKTDSGSPVSCNPCSEAQILAIYNYEFPTIQAMLTMPGNLGQLWEIANEPQVTSNDGIDPVESTSVYAYEWDLYAPLIRGLDPSAKLMSGAMLGIGASASWGYCCSPNSMQSYYEQWINSLTQPGPDYVGLDLYPSETNMADAVSVAEDDYASLTEYTRGLPIYVKELGVNYSTADESFAPTLGEDEQYMGELVPYLLSRGVIVDWFIGNDWNDWQPTSLEDNGVIDPLGEYYLGLVPGGSTTATTGPTNTETFTPTATPSPSVTPTMTLVPSATPTRTLTVTPTVKISPTVTMTATGTITPTAVTSPTPVSATLEPSPPVPARCNMVERSVDGRGQYCPNIPASEPTGETNANRGGKVTLGSPTSTPVPGVWEFNQRFGRW